MADDKQNKSLTDKAKEVYSKGKGKAEALSASVSDLIHAGAVFTGEVKRSYDLSVQGDPDEARKIRAERRVIQQEKNAEDTARQVPEFMADAGDEEKAEKIAKVAKDNPDFASDWVECCKMKTDEEIRKRWAKLMAQEADRPGAFSHRTLSVFRDMGRKDVQMFEDFCQFVVSILVMPTMLPNLKKEDMIKLMHAIVSAPEYPVTKHPIIYDPTHGVFPKGFSATIRQLESLSLLSFNSSSSYGMPLRALMPSVLSQFVLYRNAYISLGHIVSKDASPRFQMGQVVFTTTGTELFNLCNPQGNKDFQGYLVEEWKKLGYNPVVCE